MNDPTTTWFMKSLGDGLWAPVALTEIEEQFQPLYVAAGRPAEMAVFTRSDDGGLHCQVTAFFAPAASAVAHTLAAQPCARPPRAGLALVAGDVHCWTALFAEDADHLPKN